MLGQYVRDEASLQRGDVVVIRSPDDDKKTLYVKRIIGLPGDTIYADDKSLIVNGEIVDQLEGTGLLEVSVPEGCVYVMGDNRAVSYDSRFFGPVPQYQVVAKILFLLG